MKRSRVCIATIGTLILITGSAFAQGESTPMVATDSSLGEASKMRAGIVLSPMPLGSFKSQVAGMDLSTDATFAFGIMPTFDYSLNQFLFVGLSPQFIFNVKGKDSNDNAAQQLDLRARVGGIAKVADTIRLFGYAAPGYSIIMDSEKPDGVSNAKGFVLGFAAGALFDLSPGMFLTGEVGYQVGFQSIDIAGTSTDAKSNYLHLGVGLGFRI